MEKIFNVPQEFMDMSVIKYPPHQKSKNIEAKVYEEIIKNSSKLNSQLIYLPIQWTNYFVKNQYGKNISKLQNYLDSLPSNNKYFSVVQYAGGPLIEKIMLFSLELVVFLIQNFMKIPSILIFHLFQIHTI